MGADKSGGAGTMTTAHTCTLFWNNKMAFRTIPIDIKGNNVATFYMATGYQRFHDYCLMTNVEQYETDPLTQMEVDACLISDDEGSDWNEHEQTEMDTDSDAIAQDESMPADDDPSPRSFNLNGHTTSDM